VGSGVCAHGQLRVRCRTCAPVQYAMHLIRNRTAGMLRRAGLAKQHCTNTYLGCSGGEFSAHITAKMAAWNAEPAHAVPELQMTLASIKIDHIKPCAAADPSDMRAITHFTNTQPLLKMANRVMSNRWSAVNNACWLAHISHNASFRGIYWPVACRENSMRPVYSTAAACADGGAREHALQFRDMEQQEGRAQPGADGGWAENGPASRADEHQSASH